MSTICESKNCKEEVADKDDHTPIIKYDKCCFRHLPDIKYKCKIGKHNQCKEIVVHGATGQTFICECPCHNGELK